MKQCETKNRLVVLRYFNRWSRATVYSCAFAIGCTVGWASVAYLLPLQETTWRNDFAETRSIWGEKKEHLARVDVIVAY